VSNPPLRVGVVAIGRNEGPRLEKCLDSLRLQGVKVVYVDSGSTDGSVAAARTRDADVVLLDMNTPFTAARARNAGFERLRQTSPDLAYIQFVDGDCEIAATWLPLAAAYLASHGDVAVVSGRRRERHPERSVFNMMCDLEWNTPVGEARYCGGDALMRIGAYAQVGGFRADLIAGEEPELCVRLRAAGWRIWRLDAEMTLHDADMTRFSQWWIRTLRTGYAFAQGAALHGAPPERHWMREARSARVWGGMIPAMVLVLFLIRWEWSLLLLCAYPLQVAHIALKGGGAARENWLHAVFLVLGKFPEALGQVKFLWRSVSGGPARLIEYK